MRRPRGLAPLTLVAAPVRLGACGDDGGEGNEPTAGRSTVYHEAGVALRTARDQARPK